MTGRLFMTGWKEEWEIREQLKQLDTVPLPDKEQMLKGCESLLASERASERTPEKASGKREAVPRERQGRRKKVRQFCIRRCLLSACVVAAIFFLGITGFAVVAEAKEYGEAMAFFEENQLSSDGLTRTEIKEVYRDIVTGCFANGKTAEVIERTIGGYEIFQNAPTPEELEALWNFQIRGNNGQSDGREDGSGEKVSYRYYETERLDEELGFEVVEGTVLEKYEEGNRVWKVELSDCCLDGYVSCDGAVIAYGWTPTWSSEQSSFARLTMVDTEGKVLWDLTPDNGFRREYIGAVLPAEDGVVVISRGDYRYLCVSRYDWSGNRQSFVKNEVGNYGIGQAVRLGDGYLVRLQSGEEGEKLIKLEKDGTAADSFCYTSDDDTYFIVDMLEYGGSVYLSAYAVPKLGEDRYYGNHSEIEAILERLTECEDLQASDDGLILRSQELTRLVQENYTAILLACDTRSGIPNEFYSVKNCLGGRLALDEAGHLQWDTEFVTDVYFSPCTSSFSLGGTSYVSRYTFDESGRLLSQEKTGETVGFRR